MPLHPKIYKYKSFSHYASHSRTDKHRQVNMAVNSKIVTGVVAGIMILAWILYIVANAVPSW